MNLHRELYLRHLAAKMADPLTEAVKQAQHINMSVSDWWSIAAAFLFGGFTSAIWTWREARRKPTGFEICSTFLVSGLIAIVIVCLLIQYGISMPLVIAISILTGFSGDIIIRLMVRMFIAVAKKTGGYQEPNDDKKKDA